MFRKTNIAALILTVVLALLLACSGGSDSASNGAPPQRETNDLGVSDELFVSNGAQVLAMSAEQFQAGDVTSLSSDVTFSFSFGPLAVSGEMDFVMELPDKMHMSMSFEGGDGTSVVDLSQLGTFELLVRDHAFYVNMPFLGGWFVLSAEELGSDFAAVQDLAAEGSPFDYASFLGQLPEQVEYVGDEEVNGVETVHYRWTGDLQSLIASFGDALAATGDNAFADQILSSELTGPIAMDLWLGKSNLLPYKIAAAANMETPQGVLTMDLDGNFGRYNEPVTIPAAPADARSFSELFGALGGEPAAE